MAVRKPDRKPTPKACPPCRGTGHNGDKRCNACNGTGKIIVKGEIHPKPRP